MASMTTSEPTASEPTASESADGVAEEDEFRRRSDVMANSVRPLGRERDPDPATSRRAGGDEAPEDRPPAV